VSELAGVVVAAAVLAALAVTWVASAVGAARRARAELVGHGRARQAELAAAEAADEDPVFAPDRIRETVAALLGIGESVWLGTRAGGLSERRDGRLIAAWARSRAAALGRGLRLDGDPSIELLQVINRSGQSEDRVTVRVRCWVHCQQPASLPNDSLVASLGTPHRFKLDERWTLGRIDGTWGLLSVDGDPLAGPVLSAPLIPAGWADEQRLREQALAELAQGDAPSPSAQLREIVSATDPPSVVLGDLSLIDGRFSPALLASTLEHLIGAWEQATISSDAPLHGLATHEVIDALLRPVEGTGPARLILRDTQLKAWEPTRLDFHTEPPRIAIAVTIRCVRFLVSADTGEPIRGNPRDPQELKPVWTLELTESPTSTWKLVASTNIAAQIPHAS